MKTAPIPPSRFILILGTLSALGPLSIDMYLPAFPSIATSLKASLPSVETSLAAYFAGLSIGQIFYGPLADRFGRKLPLLLGLMLYALSSIACALAQNIEAIIFFRFLQALGACAGMVISRAVVRDQFGHQESARIFSLLMLVMGVAPILAPLVGGFVAKTIGWRMIFWILVAFSTACMLAVLFLLPETHKADPTIKLSRSLPVYAGILQNRRFLHYSVSGSLAQAGMFAYITGSPAVFIEYFGIPADQFGWIFGSNALGLIAMSQLNAHLLKAHSYDKILSYSIPVLTLAGVLLVTFNQLGIGFWGVVLPLFLFITTLGATFPNTSAGALASQHRHAGSASALLGTIQMLSAALASTLVSQLHGFSTLAMTSVVGGCGAASFLFFKISKKEPSAPSPGQGKNP